jgi:hypothetical protein
MKVVWKQSSFNSIIELDTWRENNGWSPIGEHLVEIIEAYFLQQDLSRFTPGRVVAISGMQFV